MLGLDGIHRASSSRIGPRASVRSSRLTTIGLSRRFLAGSNAAADNYRIGNARSSFHGGLSRTRVRLPPPPPILPNDSATVTLSCAAASDESSNDPSVLGLKVAKRAHRQPLGEKTVDETILLKRPRRGARLREEVWQRQDGQVTKYNLAYVNHLICQTDNGRVLGYDNSHGFHHRHFMGKVETIKFKDYETLASRFRDEVQELWRKEDEKNR